MSRPDGRRKDELRPMSAKVGIIPNADGSAMFQIGKTIAIAAVYGPKELYPRRLENAERATIKCYYDMYSFSVPERKRPGPDRRSTELSKVIKHALEPAVFLENYPKAAIELYINIVQADAGTRCAAISAASLALADAGIAMRDMVAAVACGRINGEIVVDLSKEDEDTEHATDIPVAYMPRLNKITLLQLDGIILPHDFSKAVEAGIEGCRKIVELQKQVLKEKYKVINGDLGEDKD